MGKTYLITGSSGFIGSHLTETMLDSGYNLYLLIRKKPALLNLQKKNNQENIRYISYDLTDCSLTDISISDKIDGIIHIASIRGETSLSEDYYHEVNVQGTKILLEVARKNLISNFLYISTVGVLGTIPAHQPATPLDAVNPDSKYHRSKWQAEELVRKYQSDKLKTIILRPTITYGRNDNGFIFRLINMVREQKFFYPGIEVWIHVLYVNAFCSLILNILENDLFDNQCYIVADENPVKLNDIVELISLNLHSKSYPAYHKLPVLIFKAAESLLKLTGKTQLLSSLKLISRDWRYDISASMEKLNYKPVNTLDIMASLMENYLKR